MILKFLSLSTAYGISNGDLPETPSTAQMSPLPVV